MKKFIVSTALVGLFGIASLQAAFDGTIGLGNTPGRTGQGGPFTITVLTANTPAMQQAINNGNPFLSFCLEQTEHVDLSGNQGYNVNVNTAAVSGGGGAVAGQDAISLATAWLYKTFRANNTTGLDAFFVANFGSVALGRTALQEAIWYLEQAQNTGNNALVTLAMSTLGLNAGNVRTIDANGAWGVKVLNLYSANVNTAGRYDKLQDQLVLVPEPSTYVAGALLLIPVLAQVRRWKRSA